MRKGIRPLISMTVLVIMIGAIFCVWKPRVSFAQVDGFRTYKLAIYCGNSGVASIIFGHEVTEGGTEGRPLMGTHFECAGNCPIGGTITLDAALARLPAGVSKALNAKLEKHEQDAAAGNGRSLAGCDCDPEALERAKAEYRKWLEVYQSQRANADALSDEASKVARDGEKLFTDYFMGSTRTLVLKVLGKLSKPAAVGERLNTNPGTRDAVIKDAVSIFRDLSAVIKGGKWKGAAPVSEVIAMLMDLGIANAKMLTLLGEFDRYAKEGAKAADAALDALQKTRLAKEKVDALEARCRTAQSSTSPPKEDEGEDDEYKPTGQREYEAAMKLKESWKRVDEGYIDAQGSWHDADSALQRALEIIRSGETGAAEEPLRRVGLALDDTAATVLAQNSVTKQKAIEAGNLMSAGFGKEARALGAYQRVLAELDRIKKIAASRNPGPKPASR